MTISSSRGTYQAPHEGTEGTTSFHNAVSNKLSPIPEERSESNPRRE